MRIRIRGRYYTFRFGRAVPGAVGHYDPDRRELVVSPSLRGEQRLDTVIHELLHAALPDLDEDAVNTTASDIARLLWRLGYRDDTSK